MELILPIANSVTIGEILLINAATIAPAPVPVSDFP